MPRIGPALDGLPMPPRAESATGAPFSRQVLPPWLVKLSTSTDFRQSNYTLALAAAVGATVAGPSFQLPKGMVGWLQVNEIYVLAPTAASTFSMQILINQGPVPGYDNIVMPPGVAQFVRAGDEDMAIRIPDGALVSTVFTNLAAVAVTVGGLIQGWYHPRAAELAAWGEEL